MIGIQPGMDIRRQIRKFDTRIADAPTDHAATYLAYLKGRMLATIALGAPQPASNFLPMYEEEFNE